VVGGRGLTGRQTHHHARLSRRSPGATQWRT